MLPLDYFSQTSVGGGDAISVSRCRSFRIPASSTLLGANLRSHRKRLASPPAAYRTFGRTAIAAFKTASATTPGSSAAAITSFSVLPKTARTSRYSSSFEKVDLKSPATTVALLKMNAVVGLQGTVDANNHITRLGVTCALCHSTVDNSVMAGIGRRKDGWPNRDLNVGAIIALSPVLAADKKAVYQSWGPGKYDPRYNQDGKNTPLVLPPAYGLAQVKNETYTAEGPISYWNAYVAVTQMGGQGNFSDPRLGIDVKHSPDMVRPSSRRCAPTSTACRRLPLRPEASMPPSPSADAPSLTGHARAATLAGRAPITTVGLCTRRRTPASMERMRRAQQTRPIARRLCVRCGSTRRISTTAARPRSLTSWRITTGFVNSISPPSNSESSLSI